MRCIGRGRRIHPKPKPIQTAGKLAFNRHFTFVIHLGHEGLLLLQSPHQHRCAAIHKSLGQTHMQRIRQAVFYSAGLVAPMAFVCNPAFALRNIGPSSDIGQPFRQSVDVAFGFIDSCHSRCHPIGRNPATTNAAPNQKFKYPRQKRGMLAAGHPAKVRDPSDLPQQFHPLRPGQARVHLGHFDQGLQRQHIIGVPRPT